MISNCSNNALILSYDPYVTCGVSSAISHVRNASFYNTVENILIKKDELYNIFEEESQQYEVKFIMIKKMIKIYLLFIYYLPFSMNKLAF